MNNMANVRPTLPSVKGKRHGRSGVRGTSSHISYPRLNLSITLLTTCLAQVISRNVSEKITQTHLAPRNSANLRPVHGLDHHMPLLAPRRPSTNSHDAIGHTPARPHRTTITFWSYGFFRRIASSLMGSSPFPCPLVSISIT